METRQLPSKKWVKVTKTLVTTESYTVTELLENNEYEFRVIAVNKVGPGAPSVGTSPIKIKPQYEKPSPPTEVTAEVTSATSVTVTWKAPTNDGGTPVIHYVVEYKAVDDRTWRATPEIPSMI